MRASRLGVLPVLVVLVLACPLVHFGPDSSSITHGSSDCTPLSEMEKSEMLISEPINITCNDDFVTQGWPGNGTADDPYLIEGLSISSDSCCISVRNADVWFVISDCWLYSATPFDPEPFSIPPPIDYAGVHFFNVTHGTVTGCRVSEKPHGFLIYISHSCTIVGNRITNCAYCGVSSWWWFSSSSNITVSRNNITGCGYGLWLLSLNTSIVSNNLVDSCKQPLDASSLFNCTVSDNRFTDAQYDGVRLFHSDRVRIVRNEASEANCAFRLGHLNSCFVFQNSASMSEIGVDTLNLVNTTFEQNIISHNGRGFEGQQCINCTISYNEFSDSDAYGLYLSGSCTGNTVYGNVFSGNGGNNAQDYGTDNQWDDGVSVGNTWDDYVGIGYYTVTGYSSSIDRYPSNPEHAIRLSVFLVPAAMVSAVIVCLVIMYRGRQRRSQVTPPLSA